MKIGTKINNLTLIKLLDKTEKKQYGLFQCDCYTEKRMRVGSVISGNSKRCGKGCKILKQKYIDRTSQTCSKCDQEYIISPEFFSKNKNFPTGFNTICRTCINNRTRASRRVERGEKSLDQLLSVRYVSIQLRMKKNVVNFDCSYLKLLWNKQDGRCAISNIPMTYKMGIGRVPTNVSVDRINSAKSYSADNIQLVCMAVNQMKSNLQIDELIFFCKEIIKNNKNV